MFVRLCLMARSIFMPQVGNGSLDDLWFNFMWLNWFISLDFLFQKSLLQLLTLETKVGGKYCILCWWCIWLVPPVVWRNLSDIVQLSFVVRFFLLSLLKYMLLPHISYLEKTIGHHFAPVATSLHAELVNMWFWCMIYVGIMNCISGSEKCQVHVHII